MIQLAASLTFMIYHICKNPEVQKKLKEEASRLMKIIDGCVTAKVLYDAKYAQAIIKESLRLNPPAFGSGRILNTDLILSGYRVPKGVSKDFLLSKF